MKQLHIMISGKVQGVFFRAHTKKEADKLGIKGWARNVDGDKVEIIAQGDENKLQAFLEFCKNGPDIANVSDINVKNEKVQEIYQHFSIRY